MGSRQKVDINELFLTENTFFFVISPALRPLDCSGCMVTRYPGNILINVQISKPWFL